MLKKNKVIINGQEVAPDDINIIIGGVDSFYMKAVNTATSSDDDVETIKEENIIEYV